MTTEMASPAMRRVPTQAEATAVFARIGLLSFGGPAAQIALMHRMLVEERGWVSEARFLHALNYCMLLPGPEAMQLATYTGWLMHGVRGGLIAGLLFLMPGAVVITALSILYLVLGDAPAVEGLLFGLKAAVLAIVLDALVRVSGRALKGPGMVALAVVAFVGIAFLGIPFPLIVLGAAVAGALLHSVRDAGADVPHVEEPVPAWAEPRLGRLAATSGLWLALWMVPLAAFMLLLGETNVFAAEARLFSILAAVTFGGAYAVLAYVAQQAVEVYGWLRPDEMLTGLGLAETPPGPLLLVLAFVGFLGGARHGGLEPLAGGLAGVLVSLWFTFVPCFLWVFAGAPYVETVRKVQWLAASLAGVTAAVVGVIANLALWFGLHVLFAQVGEMVLGPFTIPLPVPGSIDVAAVVIAAAAAFALLRLRVNLLVVLAVAMLTGIGISLA